MRFEFIIFSSVDLTPRKNIFDWFFRTKFTFYVQEFQNSLFVGVNLDLGSLFVYLFSQAFTRGVVEIRKQ